MTDVRRLLFTAAIKLEKHGFQQGKTGDYYIDTLEQIGGVPDWLNDVSPRTAHALLKYDHHLWVEELFLKAFDNGLSIESIPNLGRKNIEELEKLITALRNVKKS